ncbi:thioredoxin family protein [Sphingobacterium faecium]|uniref:thioredoxin family protein n=1 Tax=Sphingobacterium faecium TaxID=34087 RepID=UPI00097F0363|nr:thioredoxin family protein [Sphingobacterium faecium]WGQ14445.1 thioredoxin family protein [Sphingobacterium faecium]SJN48015.1 Thioredoxin Disulfide Isomerase [Sphingobacterium faecium PCAi_F2.5]HCU43932.1 thioredoxin family protein [Sphingobacterium sp.]
MKLLLILCLGIIPTSLIWSDNYDLAQQEAKIKHKNILINFSGSDWCVPCIRLRKEIFESAVFQNYAADKLILVSADFPRQKKNRLSVDQVKRNETLAEQYNPNGKFPYTLLLDENGKILKSWDGYPNIPAERFVKEVSSK